MNRAFPVLLFIAIIAVASIARGQNTTALGEVQGTSLGKDQNDSRDYVNSLIPAPEKFGKGEKKTQVSRAELKSNSIKDSTFGGSLLNMGIDTAEPKLDESKHQNAQTEAAQKSATIEKQPEAAAKEPVAAEKPPGEATQRPEDQETFSNLSMTATLGDALSQEDKAAAEAKMLSGSGDTHNRDQSGTSGDKTSTATSSDKSSDPKPNGDH